MLMRPNITETIPMNYRRFIFEKMLRHGYVGGKHTHEDNIPKGAPPTEYKAIRKEIKQLIKEGYIIVHPKPDGRHLSLNPRRIKDIEKYLEEKLE